MSVQSVEFSGAGESDTAQANNSSESLIRMGEHMGGTKTAYAVSKEDGDELYKEVTEQQPQQQEQSNPDESQQKNDRPEWLPEKFKSPDEMAKAYAELEKKLSSGAKKEEKQPQTKVETKDSPKKESKDSQETAEETESITDKGEAAGKLSEAQFTHFSEEYANNGELSEESYTALESAGIPKTIVDSYIKGQQALVDSQINAVYNQVGGKETYQQMLDWAERTLDQGEIDAFNEVIASGDQAQTKLAVTGLFSRYSSVSKAPRLVNGSPSIGDRPASAPFRSTAEVVEAMSSPKYAKDAAYRKEVERRLEMSDVL